MSPTRDAEAAKRFFLKALHSTASSVSLTPRIQEQVEEPAVSADLPESLSTPRVINVDKNAAYPKAIADLKATGMLPEGVELRQVKYLNNLVEQDHRCIKRLVKPGMGFFSFETAGRTRPGLRGHAHASQGTGQRGGQSRHHWAGHLHRQSVWSGRLS